MNCELCEIEFQPKRERQRFCSASCARRSTPSNRKQEPSQAFAAKVWNELPSPDKVLTGNVPQMLREMFQDARIHIDRYWAALANEAMREKGIERKYVGTVE